MKRSKCLSRLGRLFLIAYFCTAQSVNGEKNHYRFEFKHSFKGPHLMQPDQTIPFWSLLGDTVPADEKVRLVPSIRDKKGLVWSKLAFPYGAWKIEVDLRIDGRGKIGADGMGIWYTDSQGELGPVYGSKDYFNGVGIFLDSFDNDNRANNPYISVVVNNGMTRFDHSNDGINEQSGGCLRDFRNRPFPVRVRVTYDGNQIAVYYSAGNFEDDDFEYCTSVDDVQLPPNGYFGVSAATGGLGDDHDVLRFLTWSLHDKSAEVPEQADMQEDERKQMQEDYERNVEDFNKMQEEYKKQHPDSAKMEQHPDRLFEGAASQELTAIFEVQSSIKRDIRYLSDNVDKVIHQQLSIQAIMNSIDDTVRSQPRATGDEKPPAGADDSAKKYHIDNVLNMQRENYDVSKQMRDTLNLMEHTINNMDVRIQQQANRVAATGDNGAVRDSYEAIQHRQDIQQKFHQLQNDVTALLHKQPTAPKVVCPKQDMPSCVSLGVFIAIAVIQIVVLIIYHAMKTSREDAAKKFF